MKNKQKVQKRTILSDVSRTMCALFYCMSYCMYFSFSMKRDYNKTTSN